MFGNLRLYERHQTPTSYQVLSMQNQFVTLVFSCQKSKFVLIFYSLTHQILCSSSPISLFSCWMLYIHTYGVSFTMPMILDCHEQYGQVSVF